MPTEQLIHARWVIPVEPADRVLEHHCLRLKGDLIAEILPSAEARIRYPQLPATELPTHTLIPGLVNAHTHAAMNLLRGIADDLPLHTWLAEHIWPAEGRWLSAEFVRDGTRLAVAEMLRGGITCFSDMYFFPEIAAEVALEAGIRAVLGLVVIDFPTPWADGPDQALEKGLSLHAALHNHPLIGFTLAPHAPYSVSDAPLMRIRVLADQLGLPIHMHIHETAQEVAEALANTGERPLARLDRLGLISPELIAVHVTQLEAAEIDRLAETGVSVTHCPESNLKLASGFCPVARLRKAGINVALGTDGAASNNDLDLFGEMRTAALLAKGVAGDATAIPAAEALRMATLGGALALGMGERIGSLEVGKQADLVAVDLGLLETHQPVYHPVSHLVYAASRHQISDVWVAGKRLLHGRVLTRMNESALFDIAAKWQERLTEKPT
ncbi:MAG: TRZ/ATZ family hydrolase [Halothiobacillaceae bacterium]|jgi:5-methylthioadenosine/S-adenosylhomocysteine deaminase|nr:TRZ/ATZ family hydrolase [Halothiobacillaceae bacterium]